MSKSLNKKNYTPLGTIIILITLLAGVIFAWQYRGVLKEEIPWGKIGRSTIARTARKRKQNRQY